jgi:hypothetical protein
MSGQAACSRIHRDPVHDTLWLREWNIWPQLESPNCFALAGERTNNMAKQLLVSNIAPP